MSKYAYLLGCQRAFSKLGMPLEGQSMPEEEMDRGMQEEEEVPEELIAALIAAQNSEVPPGMPPEGMEGMPPEGMEGMPPEDPGQSPTAEMFVDFANQDGTEGEADPNAPIPEAPGEEDETPSWSGNTSLEGGDAGTRNDNMGLPSSSGA